MLEHQMPSPPTVLPIPTPPEAVTQSETRVEDYLEQVFAPLGNERPVGELQEIRSEMKSHLLALIAAHQELGHTPEEAIESALRQFGPPKCIAAQWRREWERQQRRTSGGFLQTSKFALLSGLAATVGLANVGMACYYWIADFAHGPMVGCWSYLDCFHWTAHCLPLLLAGGLVGLRVRHRPVSSVFWTVLLTFPATVVGIEAVRLLYHLEPSRDLVAEARDLIANWTPCYLFLSCLGAQAGARLRQWRVRSCRILALR